MRAAIEGRTNVGKLSSYLVNDPIKFLSGKTILITRAVLQADEFVRLIEEHGGHAVLFPTIQIIPPTSWDELDRALDGLYMYDGLLFTSANGIECFLRRYLERGFMINELWPKQIFAVGEKTKDIIERRRLKVTAVPEKFTVFDLQKVLQQDDLHGKTYLFPRGNLSPNTLPENLKTLGASVDAVTVYQTIQPKPENLMEVKAMLDRGQIDVITFTSPSTVKNFASLFSRIDLESFCEKTHIAVIGPVTEGAVREIDLKTDIVPTDATAQSLVEAMIKHFHPSAQYPVMRHE